MKLTAQDIQVLAIKNGYEFKALRAVILVESGGTGFDPKTGKILIQFEPCWFKKKAPDAITGKWAANKVDLQPQEWAAFNDAFAKNPTAAMECTSIGMMQVMGFHWKKLGFASVGALWDFGRVSEANQVELAIRFIKTNPKMDAALKAKNWPVFAYYYNGEQYKKFKYDTRLFAAYNLS